MKGFVLESWLKKCSVGRQEKSIFLQKSSKTINLKKKTLTLRFQHNEPRKFGEVSMKEQKILEKIKINHLANLWLFECSRVKNNSTHFQAFSGDSCLKPHQTYRFIMLDSNNCFVFSLTKNIYIFLFFLAIFRLVKPLITSSKKDLPCRWEKHSTFLSNEYGHKEPSFWSEKNCKPSWEIKALGLLVFKHQLSIFWLFWQHWVLSGFLATLDPKTFHFCLL